MGTFIKNLGKTDKLREIGANAFYRTDMIDGKPHPMLIVQDGRGFELGAYFEKDLNDEWFELELETGEVYDLHWDPEQEEQPLAAYEISLYTDDDGGEGEEYTGKCSTNNEWIALSVEMQDEPQLSTI